MVIEVKFTRLTHKIATQLQLVAESRTIYSSLSRRPVRKLLDTTSYIHFSSLAIYGINMYSFIQNLWAHFTSVSTQNSTF